MKTTKLFTAALLASALFVSACANQEFVLNGGSGSVAKSTFHHFFVAGIGQTQTVDAARVCGGANNIVSVEAELSFAAGIVNVLLAPIYTPRHYRVTCRS